MDFFSAPREHPLFARLSLSLSILSSHSAPRIGTRGPRRDVLRAAATPGGSGSAKKIQPPICEVGGLFNCDIQFLPRDPSFFSFFFPLVCAPSAPFGTVPRLSLAVFEASRWFIRAARSLIFRDGFFSSPPSAEARRRLARE